MRSVWIALIAFWSPALLSAQTGSLEGTIRDATQAVVPDAIVSCIQDETGFRFTDTSDEQGLYHFVVPEGHYKIVVRRDGFRLASRAGIAVAAGRASRVDFDLQTWSIFEKITVSDTLSTLEQAAPIPGGVITIRPDDVRGLPRNDNTVMGLLSLAPGILLTPANGGEAGQISSLGARPNTNSFEVDGSSANSAVSGAGWPSYFPGGTLPALTAFGTTHGLVVADAIEEVRLSPEAFAPESGDGPGASVQIQTRSGSNQMHGSLFAAARPQALGANDWFANRYALGRSSPALSNVGGSFGGPLRRNRTYFFAAAERLHLAQTYAWTTTVPSKGARVFQPPDVQYLFNFFPLPNGPDLNDDVGQLVGNKAQPADLTAVNARLDHDFDSKTRATLRLAVTPSSTEGGFLQTRSSRYWYGDVAAALTRNTARWTHESRFAASRMRVNSALLSNEESAGEFYSQFPGLAANFSTVTVGGAGSISIGQPGQNRQDVMQASHTAVLRAAAHQLKLGVDYRLLHPVRHGPQTNTDITFESPNGLVQGLLSTPVWMTLSEFRVSSARLHRLSGFAQDTWQISPRFTATFGVRWLWPRAPRVAPGSNLYLVRPNEREIDYAQAPAGTPFWGGSALLFDPSVSLAARLTRSGSTLLRASWASFHQSDFAVATDQINATPFSAQRMDSQQTIRLRYGFALDLRVPVFQRGDVTLQQSLSRRDSIALSYSGASGIGLLRRHTAAAPPLGQVTFASNDGSSNYHALNAAYRRSLGSGFQGSVSYAWSHSIDTGSQDSALFLFGPGRDARMDRGNSSFDVRHNLSVAATYDAPERYWLTRGWTMGAVVSARTGFPVDVVLSETRNGQLLANAWRPDVVPEEPQWIRDANAPGGRRLNQQAFRYPARNIGNLGRNSVRGFGMWQADLAAERTIPIRQTAQLAVRVEAFNLLNHPGFADPVRFWSNPTFGLSSAPLSLMMGGGSPASGQPPAFQKGGPRSLQLQLRLRF